MHVARVCESDTSQIVADILVKAFLGHNSTFENAFIRLKTIKTVAIVKIDSRVCFHL